MYSTHNTICVVRQVCAKGHGITLHQLNRYVLYRGGGAGGGFEARQKVQVLWLS